MIVYKKTDEWYIEWHRMTTSDNEWQQVVQRMTPSLTTHRVVQGMTTSDTTSDNEWYQVVQQVTTNDRNDSE